MSCHVIGPSSALDWARPKRAVKVAKAMPVIRPAKAMPVIKKDLPLKSKAAAMAMAATKTARGVCHEHDCDEFRTFSKYVQFEVAQSCL